jgi:UDP-glucose 4-epimerase
MASCLVTGGAGFIGSHLVEALVRQGHGVRVLDDFSTGHLANLKDVSNQIEIRSGSVVDEETVRTAVMGVEWVFHLAAIASVARSIEDPMATHEVCATGTLRLLDTARRAGVRRVVYAASASAYGPLSGGARRETDPLTPLSPYAAAKLAGEYYCQSFTSAFGLETVRLRFFNVFGPRQDPKSPYSGVIALFIAAMLQGRPPTIHGDGLQTRDFIYVTDAVQALLQTAEAPNAAGNVYNIGSGAATSILDLVDELNRQLGTAIQPQHGPARAGDVRHSLADISAARNELNFQPRMSFSNGLEKTIQWYGQHPAPV